MAPGVRRFTLARASGRGGRECNLRAGQNSGEGEGKDPREEEEAQAAVIQEFLPAALTEEEIKARVTDIIAQTGATSMADMGKVMGLASKAMAGQADGKVISQFVRAALQS